PVVPGEHRHPNRLARRGGDREADPGHRQRRARRPRGPGPHPHRGRRRRRGAGVAALATATVSLRNRAELQLSTGVQLGLVVLIGAALFVVFRGTSTLPHHDDAPLFSTLNGVRDWVDANRTINPVFLYVFGPIRSGIDLLSEALTVAFDHVSWVGVLAIATALGLVLVSWRTALLVACSLAV